MGVIFDLDGVLVASASPHRASWKAVARQHGLHVSDADFHQTFGQRSSDIIRRLWRQELSDEQIRAIDDQKEAAYRALITGMVPLTIGTRELLEALRSAGLALAIATSGPPQNLDLVLDETRIRPYFTATVNGFDVPNGKPAPDCFLLAAQRCGLKPAAAVVVEDAPVGIAAARAAGMPVIALVGTHSEPTLHDAGATHVVDRLTEITPQLVARLVAA